MSDTQIILKPEHCYHIYNHAVGNEILFDTDNDYTYFLAKLKEYIGLFGDLQNFRFCHFEKIEPEME